MLKFERENCRDLMNLNLFSLFCLLKCKIFRPLEKLPSQQSSLAHDKILPDGIVITITMIIPQSSYGKQKKETNKMLIYIAMNEEEEKFHSQLILKQKQWKF